MPSEESTVHFSKPPHARLGVRLGCSVLGRTVVEEVSESSPARGLLLPGDVCIAINGKHVSSPEQAASLLFAAEQVSITRRRSSCSPRACLASFMMLLATCSCVLLLISPLSRPLPPPAPHPYPPTQHISPPPRARAPSLAPPAISASMGYSAVRWKGSWRCRALLDISTHHAVPTLRACLHRCDAMRAEGGRRGGGLRSRCMGVDYSAAQRVCVLKRRCMDGSLVLGSCLPSHRYCAFVRGASTPPRTWLGNYTALVSPGRCGEESYRIESLSNASLVTCLRACNRLHYSYASARRFQLRMRRCETVGYEEESGRCSLYRPCEERLGLSVGLCHPLATRCFFTRGSTSRVSAERREANRSRAMRAAALSLAGEQLVRMQRRVSVCGKSELNQSGQPVDATWNRNWRYYTLVECGGHLQPSSKLCLAFKTMGKSAYIGGLASTDGRSFQSLRELMRLPGWEEEMFVHNLAILRLEGDEYAMMGGKQGFISERGCRAVRCRLSRANHSWVRAPPGCKFRNTSSRGWAAIGRMCSLRRPHTAENSSKSRDAGSQLECYRPTRQECLTLDRRVASSNGSFTPAVGIRVARGRGLPWNFSTWSMPGPPVITGAEPPGCVDRRPPYTGYPRIIACEFDGRLSVVQHGSLYRLYARANLAFHTVAGGRHVQTTASLQLEQGWQPWKSVRIAGIDANVVDIYFFAVQANPVHKDTLLAIFPVSHPPSACIMIAFSIDGVNFSRPVSLLESRVGVRTENRRGSGRLEWRSEDHPVAGLVVAPYDRFSVLFYVHHAVRGTTIRTDAVPHVRSYALKVSQLRKWTFTALSQLK
ncbi:MAG: hypothetical protein SGPRY_009292 [Prymnesium sp.]